MRPAERAVLVGIVVVIAAVVRFTFLSSVDVQVPLRFDAGEYARYAENIVEHGVYSLAAKQPPPPDSFRSPGYPTFLAMCMVVADGDGWYDLARTLQALLSTITVLVAYRLARQFLDFGPAIAGAVLVALSPHLVVAPAYILTECTASFVVTTALWLLVGAVGWRRTLLGAVLLGMAPMCNETLLFLPFVVAVALWRRERNRALSVLAIALLPLVLWTVRNQVTTLARSGSDRAIASISHGSYPGMVYQGLGELGLPYKEDPEQPEFGQSWQNLRRVLGPRIAAEPLRYALWYLLEKPLWLWSWPLVQGHDVYVYAVDNSPYELQPVMAATHVLMRWLHLPVMLLAFLGAVLGILRSRRDSSWAPLALGLVAVLGTLAYLPVIPDPRYLQPFRPVLFVLAAATAPWLWAFWRRRERSPTAEPVAT